MSFLRSEQIEFKSTPSQVDILKHARSLFLKADSTVTRVLTDVQLYTFVTQEKTYRVFGVSKEKQADVNYDSLRECISKELGLASSTAFSQVIGDTPAYSKEGTVRSKNYLKHQLERVIPNDIILYGLTGKSSQDGSCLGANPLVNAWLDENPNKEKSQRVIANVVDFHTVEAITKWGCQISNNVVNFYLVYSPEQNVMFGDDIISSDNLTNHKAFCFDGGIQSLRQCFYMMEKGVVIESLKGLRDFSKPQITHCSETNRPYLSAAEFIEQLSKASPEKMGAVIKDYCDSHALYSKGAKDASTKNALWEATLTDINKKELWKKLPSHFSVIQQTAKSSYLRPVAYMLMAGAAAFFAYKRYNQASAPCIITQRPKL